MNSDVKQPGPGGRTARCSRAHTPTHDDDDDDDVRTIEEKMDDDCNATVTTLHAQLDACGCVDGHSTACSFDADADYDVGLHVGTVFIIFAVSSLGVALPFLAKWSSRVGLSAYAITLGKMVGTGIALACALIHMLQPAAAALTSECVPTAFNEDYAAYAYLFSMIAMLAMHCFEHVLRATMMAKANSAAAGAVTDVEKTARGDAVVVATTHAHAHAHTHHGENTIHVTVQSYSMEFAFTVHSVFIGITVGVVGRAELTALMVALCFHQFFEGIALGTRLADAELGKVQTAVFALVFAVSAPVGIASGISYVASVNPEGVTYLLVQGVFDGVCAGLLLFVSAQLLMLDFPADAERHVRENLEGQGGARSARVVVGGMFLAVWVGAGAMAVLGRYL